VLEEVVVVAVDVVPAGFLTAAGFTVVVPVTGLVKVDTGFTAVVAGLEVGEVLTVVVVGFRLVEVVLGDTFVVVVVVVVLEGFGGVAVFKGDLFTVVVVVGFFGGEADVLCVGLVFVVVAVSLGDFLSSLL
jgi:hypothetical protein